MWLQQGVDVVGMRLAVWQGGERRLLGLLTDAVVIVTHPHLAAGALRQGQPGPRAAPVGQGHLVRTEGHAAHHAVHAGALVLADWLEVLAVLVHPSVEGAGQTVGLSSTQSSLRVSSGPQVAVQPLDVIAGFGGTAVCIELPSTNFTAATVVSYPADAWRTQRE